MKRHLFLKPLLRKRRCVITGDEDEIKTIATFLAEYPAFDIVRFRNPQGNTSIIKENGGFLSLIDSCGVDEVILGETANINPAMRETFVRCRERGVAVTPFPLLYANLIGRIPVDLISERWWPLIFLGEKNCAIYAGVKRLLDIAGASLGLAVFGLLLPLIALAIKFDSPGPMFYRQVRVGKGGEPFIIWKLRTMVADAEKQEDVWSNHNDPRVTRVGRWLRRTRLDEVPQCWSILKGEISIVGPRPERLKVVEKLEKELPFYRLRHIAKPGLAGWAMVNRGHMCSFEDAKVRHEYDLYYVKHRSIWFDAQIFLRAFWHLVTMKGT